MAVHADTQREQFQQLSAPVLVDGIFMAELVIQVVNHSRVAGQLHQQVWEFTHTVGPELVQLKQYLPAVITLGVADTENAVPEQTHLLFKLPGRVDHTVSPVGLIAL